MTAPATLRPLRAQDAEAAYRLSVAAMELEAPEREDERERMRARWVGRVEHVISTDPAGAWAATDEAARLVGCTMAIVRDGLWVLTNLAVAREHQGRGLGRELLGRALAHGRERGAPDGLIASSEDPRAMRLYARAGFELRPTVLARGEVRRSSLPREDPAVRPATAAQASETEPISRFVRGATHAPDLPQSVRGGHELLLLGDRGFALADRGSVSLLAARDEQAATALLWSALARAERGRAIEIRWIAAGQDWAVAVALKAGLALHVAGPLFARGRLGPMRPYLPSGVYL